MSPHLASRPRILVGTKIDMGRDEKAVAALEKYAAAEGLRFLMISAHTGAGLKELLNLLWESLDHPERLELKKPAPAKAPAKVKLETEIIKAVKTIVKALVEKKPARRKKTVVKAPRKKPVKKSPRRAKLVSSKRPVQKPGKARAKGDRRRS